jgi:hypothetical protein
MEELDLSGWWWLPDNEDKKVPGVMTFSDDEGIRLKLIGSFKDPTQLGSGDQDQYPLILGLTGEGNLVTLFEAMPLHTSFTFPALTTRQEFWARVGCTGARFLQPEQARFHKATLEYTYLADWVGRSGFHPEYDTEGGILSKYSLTYTFPEEVKAAIANGEVCITYAVKWRGDQLRELSLSQSTCIRVDLREDLTFDEWLTNFAGPLQNLLTLATMRPNAVTRISVYSRDKSLTTSKGEREVPIDLFYQQVWHEKVQAKPLFPHDMLFTLHDVAEDFGSVLKRWLRVAKELDGVCNLFFSVRYRPTFSENLFLNTVQAVEPYHRAKTGGRRRSLRNCISYLLAVTQEVASSLITDENTFIRKVVATRNYYTHHDPRLRRKAATGSELYWLTQTLSFMVEACLLDELGLAPERRRELFKRNQRYVYAVSHKGQTGW